jgi:tRNA nucleotidyltransferase/poly(A) polymerase
MATLALLQVLASLAKQHGVAEHVYVVGGAVRNHLMGLPAKDFDLVLDSTRTGHNQDSEWLARAFMMDLPCHCNLTLNQYGVAILTVKSEWTLEGQSMKGEVVEVANARRESYGKGGKGYKPETVEVADIREDLLRRDFTVNTLLWRLADVTPEFTQPALDLLGCGLRDLERRVLATPADPDQTFTDDPTRMLRAVKFMLKYGLDLDTATAESVRRNAHQLTKMPWDAVRKLLVDDLLLSGNPDQALQHLRDLGLNEVLVGLMESEQGFRKGVSRSLAELDPRFLVKLHQAGWPLDPSPMGFLSPEQRVLLGQHLSGTSSNELWVALKSPPVNQQALFTRHNLVGSARQLVSATARAALLNNPALASDAAALEAEVSRRL